MLGTIVSQTGNKQLYYVGRDLDESNEKYDTYCAMQEDINIILDNLSSDCYFVYREAVSDAESEVFPIETGLATLYYPKKWLDSVTVDVSDDAVDFTCAGIELFKIHLGSGKGIMLGKYNGSPISFETFEIDSSGHEQEVYDMLCSMQEDFNVIYQYLRLDENFTADQ